MELTDGDWIKTPENRASEAAVHDKLTRDHANAMIAEAAAACYAAGVTPELEDVARHLQATCHDYGASWAFCLCVSIEVAHLRAQAEGYDNEWHRAWEKMVERKGAEWVKEHLA